MKKEGKPAQLSRWWLLMILPAAAAIFVGLPCLGMWVASLQTPSPEAQFEEAAEQAVATMTSDPQHARVLRVVEYQDGRPLAWYRCRSADSQGFVVVGWRPGGAQRYYRVCCHAGQPQADDLQPNCVVID